MGTKGTRGIRGPGRPEKPAETLGDFGVLRSTGRLAEPCYLQILHKQWNYRGRQLEFLMAGHNAVTVDFP